MTFEEIVDQAIAMLQRRGASRIACFNASFSSMMTPWAISSQNSAMRTET